MRASQPGNRAVVSGGFGLLTRGACRGGTPLLPSKAFVLGPSLDAVMLRDSIDLVTDLDYHCDRNQDGVLDAADYLLYNRVEEQP